MTRREALALLAGLGLLTACGNAGSSGSGQGQDASQGASAGAPEASQDAGEDVVVRVASLKGPTTIGLVSMMEQTSGIPTGDEDATDGADPEPGSGVTYRYAISASADEVLPLVVSGSADIALVPSNAAAVLYARTDGGVEVVDVNTLGVLSVVTGDEAVRDFEDLAGRTVYLAGKGASPEYTLEFLLGQAGIADQVELEWKSEHAEVAAVLADDPTAVGILPEPFTTATLAQDPSLQAPVRLADVWRRYVTDGSEFVMGVTVARREFADAHPAAVEDFLRRHAESVEAVNADPAAAAPLVVEAGIVGSEAIAERAIPSCNVVCLEGDDMRSALEGYLQVLYDSDPSSVGGALPGDDFYYGA